MKQSQLGKYHAIDRRNSISSVGFTIVELMVVIVIISIVTTLAVMSYSTVQANTRDSQRSAQISVLAEALEGYYLTNGEYPGCTDMSDTIYNIVANTLRNIEPEVLTAPDADEGTNSIMPGCADINGVDDNFAYIGDGSGTCLTGSACTRFTLKYLEESTGDVISFGSRHS